jgi:hypothetical protein
LTNVTIAVFRFAKSMPARLLVMLKNDIVVSVSCFYPYPVESISLLLGKWFQKCLSWILSSAPAAAAANLLVLFDLEELTLTQMAPLEFANSNLSASISRSCANNVPSRSAWMFAQVML